MSGFEAFQASAETRQRIWHDYGNEDNFNQALGRLKFILSFADIPFDPDCLTGNSILDLGCGSPASTSSDGGTDKIFEPWFARVCAACGGKVLGIEIYEQDEKDRDVFLQLQADLTQFLTGYNLVNYFGGNSFQFVVASRVFDGYEPSKTYIRTVGLKPDDYFDGAEGALEEAMKKHIRNLKKQALRLLPIHGILMIGGDMYQRENTKVLQKLK